MDAFAVAPFSNILNGSGMPIQHGDLEIALKNFDLFKLTKQLLLA